MTLNLDKEFPGEISFDYEETAKQVISAALDWEDCPYEAEVSLVLTTDEDIAYYELEQTVYRHLV